MSAIGYTGGDPSKVDVAGDTMTGPLVLPGDPSLPLEAATRQFVLANAGGGGGGGIPATTVTSETSFGIAPVVGTGTKYARDDHTHGSPTAPVIPAAASSVVTETSFGQTSVVGVATVYSRGDHSHGTPAAPTVPSASGTVTAETSFGIAAAAGAAAAYSRGDHTHGSPTAPTAASVGASPTGHTHVESDVTNLVTDLGNKQPLDSDLTTIAGLTATTGNMIQSVASAWASQTPAQVKTSLALVAADVGLGSVNNTSDAAKPVSTATQTALNLKADLASPTFSGTPSLPTGSTGVTQTAGDSTTKLATTAFVTTADNLKANLASPTFTGVPAAPTAAAVTNTTQLATTAFVTTADNLKANLAGPTFTGAPAAPTAAQGTNTTQLATTQYVQTEVGLLVPKSLFTTKGDIAAATAASTPARLAVGADGTFLKADSSQATGLIWATPSVTGGGGSTGPTLWLNPKSSRWTAIPIGRAGTNYSPVINRLHLIPLPIGPTGRTITGISCEVATAAGAGGLVRSMILNADSQGDPNLAVFDYGTVATDTTGVKSWTAMTDSLSANTLYWVGLNFTVSVTGLAVRAMDGFNPFVSITGSLTGTNSFGMYVMNSVSGALGATPFTYFDVDIAIRVGVRFS